ncbi:hypothetical protein [Novisyntrophococcus fermenticellae]|uniref:hypothetical protein n=1 Tax=Novisyntrophococcus fermenticellae TaxID=2068655 RepID=UPI001E4630F7|nr:hypothetical protein [Novisyntrophococcus fermenticellae]
MKRTLIELGRNLKLEIFIIVLYIIGGVIYFYFPKCFPTCLNLNTYFSKDRLAGIGTFFAITIGVYIAVITVLATSEIGISREMLKRRLDKPLIDVMMAGMTENLVTTGLAIFVPVNKITCYILLVFLSVSLVSFAKFIRLLVIIFKQNMEQMAKTIDEDEIYKNSMITYMEGIFKYFQEHRDD